MYKHRMRPRPGSMYVSNLLKWRKSTKTKAESETSCYDHCKQCELDVKVFAELKVKTANQNLSCYDQDKKCELDVSVYTPIIKLYYKSSEISKAWNRLHLISCSSHHTGMQNPLPSCFVRYCLLCQFLPFVCLTSFVLFHSVSRKGGVCCNSLPNR